jgi:hypothetical protein
MGSRSSARSATKKLTRISVGGVYMATPTATVGRKRMVVVSLNYDSSCSRTKIDVSPSGIRIVCLDTATMLGSAVDYDKIMEAKDQIKAFFEQMVDLDGQPYPDFINKELWVVGLKDLDEPEPSDRAGTDGERLVGWVSSKNGVLGAFIFKCSHLE